jgi:hypothetical protein
VVAAGYINSVTPTPTGTRLYDLDSTLDALLVQDPPNDGVLKTIGALGVDIGDDAAFDIVTVNHHGLPLHVGYLLNAGNLYTVDLATGQATLRGAVGATGTLRGLAVRPAPALPVFTLTMLTGDSTLVTTTTATPGVVVSTPITGIATKVNGIDVRPSDGLLYAVSGTTIHTVIPGTGVATLVSTAATSLTNGDFQAIDFNPVADRLRLINTADNSNLRINPITVTAVTTDTALAYAAGDANAGATPHIVAAGYTNSLAGATGTTLYDIDSTLDVLVRQAPPNDGTLNTVGSLGINVGDDASFDIVTVTVNGITVQVAYLLNAGALYRVDLSTGKATPVLGFGGAGPYRGLSVGVLPLPV